VRQRRRPKLSNNSEKDIKDLDKSVTKMFNHFPPGAGKKWSPLERVNISNGWGKAIPHPVSAASDPQAWIDGTLSCPGQHVTREAAFTDLVD